ncbi:MULTISPECIES: aldose epimerase [Stenotrophomonas]|uniref:aldose epimerase family protein n=1 Tax=Stenotrophomonas TaxID=40323 RepID=UPI0007706A2B|nr:MULTISPECIES: aldose epimerase [Stenotrophomonas]AMJ55270.1 aldose epimerase [Stenotrophomonas sp. KCTC 12332]
MAPETLSPIDDALAPMPAGQLYWLRAGKLEVALAPEAGGRIAQLRYDGVDWLIGENDVPPATIAWGCYPMVPWAGRIRRGRFDFDGKSHMLPANFGAHAIHGVGFSRPWHIESIDAATATLSLRLPQDAHWPFGGSTRQAIQVHDNRLHLQLSVEAGDQAMPAVLGWHPWFRKPEQLLFSPDAMYPRDEDGIATLPVGKPTPGPWDDCFVAQGETTLVRAGQRLRLRADSDHWVVYDGAAHATCVEPQTGPPDAFTLAPHRLAPGEQLALAFEFAWDGADT